MPTPINVKSSTPLSNTSSLNINPIVGIQQNPPFTKAQLQNTMAGTRTVKNAKEVEQLLRDYPAALELYKTGKYKVKVKREADVERVILVEKRSHRTESENISINGVSGNEQTENTSADSNNTQTTESKDIQTTREASQIRDRSRTVSKDRGIITCSPKENHREVHMTTSSIRITSNAHSKVDNHRNLSRDRDPSANSRVQSIQSHPTQQTIAVASKPITKGRSLSRDNISHTSYTKVAHRKPKPDNERMVVPYVPNMNQIRNAWNQPKTMQPYFSTPLLPQPHNNPYMVNPYISTQNQYFPQPYHYPTQSSVPISYPQPTSYVSQSTTKSSSNTNKQNISSTKYPSSSRSVYNQNLGYGMSPMYPTFNTHQQQFQYPGIPQMYHSQAPVGNHNYWSNPAPTVTSTAHSRQSYGTRRVSKHRTHSVDTTQRARATEQNQSPPQQQQKPTNTVQSSGQHSSHHNGIQTHIQVQADNHKVEVPKDSHPVPKLQLQVTAPTFERLTIRQLNEMFIQSDPSGRLPYGSVPSILNRFGIILSEQDLLNTAKELDYNVTDPISARRLVHVLVKLGKIAKSSNQTHRTHSPTMLPEDREVTDILNQRQPQNHNIYYSTAFPHPWK